VCTDTILKDIFSTQGYPQDPTNFSSKNEDYRNNDQDIMEISTNLANTEK